MLDKNLLIAVFFLSFGKGNAQNYQQATLCSLSLNITSGNVTCFGFDDGFITITPVDGTTPYTYLWSTGDTVSFLNNLVPNEYSVTVTDSAGCVSTDSITITEPSLLNAIVDTIRNVPCNYSGSAEFCIPQTWCDGFVSVLVSGGTTPYSYYWNNLGGPCWGCYHYNNDGNLWGCADTYKVTVTDSNGCTLVDTVMITAPPVLFKTVNIVNAICSTCVGSATVNLSGGAHFYNFYWDNNPSIISISSGDSTSLIDALPGTYSVEIMRAGECTLCTNVTIGWAEECWKLTANINVPGYIFTMSDNGAIVQFTFSGANAVNYFWAFGDGDTNTVQNPDHTYTNPGIYTVMLIGSNGYCSDTAYVTITILDVGIKKVGCYSSECNETVNIYSDPLFKQGIIISGLSTDKISQITIYNILGETIHQIAVPSGKSEISVGLSEFDAGVYICTVSANNETLTKQKIILLK